MEPTEIAGRTFPISRRGYDREHVDAFLIEVARRYREAINAAEEAMASSSSSDHAYESIGSHVATVLATAAKAADEMKSAAEEEADKILNEARQQAAEMREEAMQHLAVAKESRSKGEQEAAALKATARSEVAALVQEARGKATQAEAEAMDRIRKLERIAHVNVESVLADGRAQYERLRRARELCADRLASLESMIHEVRSQVPPEDSSDILGPTVFSGEDSRDDLLDVPMLQEGTDEAITKPASRPVRSSTTASTAPDRARGRQTTSRPHRPSG